MTDTRRGWTSRQLDIIEDDTASYWSTTDAAMLLGCDPGTIRNLIRLTGIQPAGKRRGIARRGGRYVRVYPAAELVKAYEVITDVVEKAS